MGGMRGEKGYYGKRRESKIQSGNDDDDIKYREIERNGFTNQLCNMYLQVMALNLYDMSSGFSKMEINVPSFLDLYLLCNEGHFLPVQSKCLDNLFFFSLSPRL